LTINIPTEPRPYPGVLITVEGGEGSGKSTQTAQLAELLRADGAKVLCTREPGATVLGAQLRRILLDPEGYALHERTEALLFAADRAEHVASVILPALRRGLIVLCDRHSDSSIAYQAAGRGLDEGQIAALSDFATGGLVPDLTLLLDVSPTVGLDRVRQRARCTEPTGAGEDRFEGQDLAFHKRVRVCLLMRAEADPKRWRILDASQPQPAVSRAALALVEDFLRQRGYPMGRPGAVPPTGGGFVGGAGATVHVVGVSTGTSRAPRAMNDVWTESTGNGR
jgi:dTMP kinase